MCLIARARLTGSQFIITMSDMKEEMDGQFASFGKVQCVSKQKHLSVLRCDASDVPICVVRFQASDTGVSSTKHSFALAQCGASGNSLPSGTPIRSHVLLVTAFVWAATLFTTLLPSIRLPRAWICSRRSSRWTPTAPLPSPSTVTTRK